MIFVFVVLGYPNGGRRRGLLQKPISLPDDPLQIHDQGAEPTTSATLISCADLRFVYPWRK